ncbi:MAG: hypothetical protein E6R04_10925 [Spirochaetes bacterium]|nr:MAG: hypothetical protein E6R04_10925 [Spirochaetota bacterium]
MSSVVPYSNESVGVNCGNKSHYSYGDNDIGYHDMDKQVIDRLRKHYADGNVEGGVDDSPYDHHCRAEQDYQGNVFALHVYLLLVGVNIRLTLNLTSCQIKTRLKVSNTSPFRRNIHDGYYAGTRALAETLFDTPSDS